MEAWWAAVWARLPDIAEVVKLLGGLASLYALFKLRQIERRYLFRATVPRLIGNIETSLSRLNLLLVPSRADHAQLHVLLNHLLVDVKNVRRKARGDSLDMANQLLAAIRATGLARRFWQRTTALELTTEALLDIYGKGQGLIHSLENDVRDTGWSAK